MATQGVLTATAPKTDCELVLSVLQAWQGEFVPNLYRVTGVMVHSRVADLRRKGYQIECKRIKDKGYCYRLLDGAEKKEGT